jgi:MscS family membrane protein
LLAFFIHWTLSKVGLSLLARQFWSSLASAITIAGCVWLLILLNRHVEKLLRRRLQSANHTGAASLLRLMRWAIDLLVIFVGVFVALHYWGIRPTAALAGLGVGGIAVAIAAQKTLENVIGAISLTIDQAARVGDFLKVGDTVGTVEEMGLRSIRIRTLDRTVVSIPNGQISDMTIEAFSLRDKFRFQPILRLRYGTTSLQMRVILARIRGLLADGISVEPASFRVRFLGFGVSSLDVEIFAYILARDWNHFLELQEGLFLQIMETLESAGVEIALPSQSIFLAAASAAENLDGHKLRKGQGANGEISEESGAAKSA